MTDLRVPRLRETPPAYGPHETDQEPYPGALILRDLSTAETAVFPRILARYAAARCRLLGDDDADVTLVHHGRVAARSYLDALGQSPETAALRRWALGTGPAAAWDAGHAAARSGHVEGAFALFRAGYLTARRGGQRRWAATLAASISVLLDDAGLDGAGLWARRSDRLRRAAP